MNVSDSDSDCCWLPLCLLSSQLLSCAEAVKAKVNVTHEPNHNDDDDDDDDDGRRVRGIRRLWSCRSRFASSAFVSDSNTTTAAPAAFTLQPQTTTATTATATATAAATGAGDVIVFEDLMNCIASDADVAAGVSIGFVTIALPITTTATTTTTTVPPVAFTQLEVSVRENANGIVSVVLHKTSQPSLVIHNNFADLHVNVFVDDEPLLRQQQQQQQQLQQCLSYGSSIEHMWRETPYSTNNNSKSSHQQQQHQQQQQKQ